MAPAAVTHANDMSQRHVPLAATVGPAGTLTVDAPAAPALAPPTYYMLFVLNDQGVPSVAKFIRLKLGAEQPPAGHGDRLGPGAGDRSSDSATFQFDLDATGLDVRVPNGRRAPPRAPPGSLRAVGRPTHLRGNRDRRAGKADTDSGGEVWTRK